MQWLGANFPAVLELVRLHLYQAVLPLVFCVIISVPLAQLARQNNVLRSIILALSSVLFTIPSLALFVFMPVLLGTRIL
ncbi:MAG: ABC transporter permease, partial [Acidobacteria bacterium]|nr:ABC transporter permease [Acidobacteriota bacterium]